MITIGVLLHSESTGNGEGKHCGNLVEGKQEVGTGWRGRSCGSESLPSFNISACIVQKVVSVADCSKSSLILSSAADICRSAWNDVEMVFIGSIMNYLNLHLATRNLIPADDDGARIRGSLIMNTIYKRSPSCSSSASSFQNAQALLNWV